MTSPFIFEQQILIKDFPAVKIDGCYFTIYGENRLPVLLPIIKDFITIK